VAKRKANVSVEKPEIRIKVRIGNGAVGPGKVHLLEQISRTGSISSAARECGMNYRRAQYLLETMGDAMGTAVVNTAVGGADGGGAKLTAVGHALVEAFGLLEQSIKCAAKPQLKAIAGLLKNDV